jgi:hypothetical protein
LGVFPRHPDTYSSVLVVSTPSKLCSGIFLISYLNGLLLTRLIADSNSRLVLYLLRKKGGLLNSLLIPAEIQRNQNLINNNNQDYARIDKSKGEDFLLVNQQMNYAREMTECGKNGYKCRGELNIIFEVVSIVLSIDFIVCFTCVVLWVGVNTWVLVV